MPDQYSNTRRAEPILSELELYSEYRNCNRWSLIVGISKYQYQGWNLQYAHRDAEEFHKLLLTPNGGRFEERHICKLVNEQATTGKITQALRSFLQKPARDDLVILYFACHGSPDPYRPDNLYLLTHDTNPADIGGTALPMREVRDAVTENLHADKVVILADTCHSGGISGGGRRNATDDSTLMNRYLQELSRATKGLATFTSAEPRQVAQEGARWGGGHGVFTYYLLEGMRGAADRDGNGIVTLGELFEYVRDNVKRATDYRQHPLIGANAYDRNLPMAIAPRTNLLQSEGDTDLPSPPNKENYDRLSNLTAALIDPIFQDDKPTINYIVLESFLRAGRWKEADRETFEIMLKIVGCQDKRFLDVEDIQKFPLQDLKTLDNLWITHSKNRFGFSLQNSIWKSEKVNGNPHSGVDVFRAFGDCVGWCVKQNENGKEKYRWFNYESLYFGLDAPVGHLPWGGWGDLGKLKRWRLGYLFSRFD